MYWKKIFEVDSHLNRTISSKDIFISPSLPVSKRRIVMVGDYNTVRDLVLRVDWLKFLPNYVFTKATLNFLDFFENNDDEKDYTKKILSAIELDDALEHFSFPPQHPINGGVYACYDLQPDCYFPLASFHEFIYQTKMNAFLELCSNLNAKEVRVAYAEEDGKKVNGNLGLENVPTKAGNLDVNVDGSFSSANMTDADILCSFPKPQYKEKEFHSPWLASEPTWSALQRMRLERDVSQLRAKFSHTDEMGISTKLAAGFQKMGVNIGGEFSTLKRRKYEFIVEFWPKE
ncbi:hypothetical protein [Salegentibacter mishustinae]|uniref:hypothetical protein n=1 Tax=Salegentibacter mishustinae TaxID=270918 RepID=UPI002492CA24|nr:hypothetical protein [Salegentibacter mishustinae]